MINSTQNSSQATRCRNHVRNHRQYRTRPHVKEHVESSPHAKRQASSREGSGRSGEATKHDPRACAWMLVNFGPAVRSARGRAPIGPTGNVSRPPPSEPETAAGRSVLWARREEAIGARETPAARTALPLTGLRLRPANPVPARPVARGGDGGYLRHRRSAPKARQTQDRLRRPNCSDRRAPRAPVSAARPRARRRVYGARGSA